MKKRSITLIFTLLIALLLISSISASVRPNRESYNTKDTIYILSSVGSDDTLCRSQNPPENVEIYIVNHKDEWNDGDSFSDVRDKVTEIPNSRFSNTKIWENPKTGNYDLIVDCDQDREYDETSEPIYSEGFSVVPKRGEASMKLGHKNPGDFEWQFDPEDPKFSKVISQIELNAIDENINLKELKIEIKSPQETNDIEVYFDKNNNGIADSDDESIINIESAQKEEEISLDYNIRQDIQENILIVFNNQENSQKGEYQIKIVSITGMGVDSKKEIKFFGNPLESNFMNIIDKKSCLGEISLEITPNPATLNSELTAKISGLTGCNEYNIKLKSNECHVTLGDIEECQMGLDSCEMKINAIKGTYFACIDKNKDKNYNGYGESASTDLKIKGESEPNNENEIEITESGKEESSKITGNAISNLGNLKLDNSLIILVEVTLVLILALLILIFYRIIRSAPKSSPKEATDDDSDLFDELKEEIKEGIKEDKKEEIFEEIKEEKEKILKKIEKDKKDPKKK